MHRFVHLCIYMSDDELENDAIWIEDNCGSAWFSCDFGKDISTLIWILVICLQVFGSSDMAVELENETCGNYLLGNLESETVCFLIA